MGEPFRHRLRVRYSECDPQGIVFNANYLTYFDVTMTELWRDALGGWDAVLGAGVDAVVAEATIRFLAPLRFDEEFEIAASIERVGETSAVFAMKVATDAATVAEGSLRYVFLDRGGGGKAPIPERIRAAMEPYVRKGEKK